MWEFIKKLFKFRKKETDKEKQKCLIKEANALLDRAEAILRFIFDSIKEKNLKKPVTSKITPLYTRATVRRRDYYKRNNKFYHCTDDSLVEDIILLDVLLDMDSKSVKK